MPVRHLRKLEVFHRTSRISPPTELLSEDPLDSDFHTFCNSLLAQRTPPRFGVFICYRLRESFAGQTPAKLLNKATVSNEVSQ